MILATLSSKNPNKKLTPIEEKKKCVWREVGKLVPVRVRRDVDNAGNEFGVE